MTLVIKVLNCTCWLIWACFQTKQSCDAPLSIQTSTLRSSAHLVTIRFTFTWETTPVLSFHFWATLNRSFFEFSVSSNLTQPSRLRLNKQIIWLRSTLSIQMRPCRQSRTTWLPQPRSFCMATSKTQNLSTKSSIKSCKSNCFRTKETLTKTLFLSASLSAQAPCSPTKSSSFRPSM